MALLILFVTVLAGCNKTNIPTEAPATFTLFSPQVQDTFHIAVSLPAGYDRTHQYPVLYVLDGNFYGNLFSPAFRQFAEVGLAEPGILVSVGYKDIAALDSLHTRDYTYPTAIPEYEMTLSGGAPKFLSFLHQTLIPHIDARYGVDTTRRTLIGHSLGGYFSLYAWTQALQSRHACFSHYVAASPSLHYNHGYLLSVVRNLAPPVLTDTTRLTVTYGSLEDADSEDLLESLTAAQTLDSLNAAVSRLHAPKARIHTYLFTNLSHMETPFPTFQKTLPQPPQPIQ